MTDLLSAEKLQQTSGSLESLRFACANNYTDLLENAKGNTGLGKARKKEKNKARSHRG